MLRVVLIAEEAAGARVLELLGSTPSVSVEAVLTSSSGGERAGSIGAKAEREGLKVLPAARARDPGLAQELSADTIDLILNVHSLYVLPADLVRAPRMGAYNLHPGPLPEMAGLDVPSWAIYLGHREHGVTLHRMTAGIDDGPIAFEDRFDVEPDATGLSLSLECVRRGVPLVERLLETALRGDPIPARPQDTGRRRYFHRRPPSGGAADFSRPSDQLAAQVRAANYRPFESPWGHPRARSEAGVIELVATTPRPEASGGGAPGSVRARNGHVEVACGTGSVVLDTILMDGRVVPAGSVLRDGEVLAPDPREDAGAE